MARRESDREDLLREATALVERIELSPAGGSSQEHVTAGFREGGALSIFFGADPVYQFNANGQLRRAYRGGLLFKAECGRLVSLRRVREQNEVRLVRHALDDSEQAAFLDQMAGLLREFAGALDHGSYGIAGQVPAHTDVFGRLRAWLANHTTAVVAATPRV